MELSQYLDAITIESDALAGVAESHPSLGVSACPGWDVADLARHLGNTQRWATRIVNAEGVARSAVPHEAPADAIVGGWLRDGAGQLRAALETVGPDKAVWTFGQPRTSAFWVRRQAQEATLHRWDAEDAVGIPPTPIDPELAADGVAELLETFLPRAHRRDETVRNGETVHVHRTDGPGEWLVRFQPEGVTVTAEHAKGDVALRGGATELLLVLWGRRPLSTVEVLGSADVVARWRELFPPI